MVEKTVMQNAPIFLIFNVRVSNYLVTRFLETV